MSNREIGMIIGEITTLAYLVNTHTEYCVFVSFSGHVNQIEVSIRRNKDDYKVRVVEDSAYLDGEYGDRRDHSLQRTRSELRKILRNNKIDYRRLPYEIEEVRHYKFT